MILKKKYLKKIIISSTSKILDVIRNLNNFEPKVVILVNEKKIFVGILNDGDIRRAFLNGYNANSPAISIVNKKPFIVKNFAALNNLSLKQLSKYFYIPIVTNKKILGLYYHKEIFSLTDKENKKKEHVVIMAGGFGKRLRPLTNKCPKALLKLNNKPLLQYILELIKNNNFYNVQVTVFFLKKMIKNFVLKKKFPLNIKFIEESKPMGTIGSIGLIKNISENFIVLNCDVICDINLSELLKFHKKNKAVLTMCTKDFKYKNPYGVIVAKNNRFISFEEKPEINFNINTGIYVFNKNIVPIINKFNLKNIEDLIINLSDKNYKIFTYPIFENWNDLGQDKKRLKRYN
jgi:dTDP-glucose pyrophosphorylase